MPIVQSRRRFLANVAVAGAAGLGGIGAALDGGRKSFAAEPPPETTTVRLRFEDTPPTWVNGVPDDVSCNAPVYMAGEQLSADGFTDIRYVHVKTGLAFSQAFARGEIDFGFMFAPGILRRLDGGVPITTLAGIHSGCLELFAHEHIRTLTDLKGKQVGIADFGSPDYLYVSIMAAHVGLDPKKDIKWILADDAVQPINLFAQDKIDAYVAFGPEAQDLRARKIGRAIADMGRDKPWADYLCCLLVGHTDFVRKYPVATKRVVRATLKATDLCSAEPERVARRLVERGFAQHYDIARQMLIDIPYASWRELDPEDALRFYALWLHEFGELKSTPNELITRGADWRFLEQVKRELKV
jgi:NitT/TauT family transport system substrate-binding protein